METIELVVQINLGAREVSIGCMGYECDSLDEVGEIVQQYINETYC